MQEVGSVDSMMKLKKLPLVFLFVGVIAVLAYAAPSVIYAFKKEEVQKVQWVNADLPPMEGLQHHVLQSDALGKSVGYVVWTPPGYQQEAPETYPVIYYFHGKHGSESSDAAGFSSLIKAAIANGLIPPTIVVFPNAGHAYRGDVITMITNELIPLIDERYRTDQTRRAVVGFSMGGAAAVRMALVQPEFFVAAVSLGGGMWHGDKALLAAPLKNQQVLNSKNFGALLINGDSDRPKAYNLLTERLREAEIAHSVVVLENQDHNLSRYYKRTSDAVMRFLAKHLQS
jgi:predicted peptidase